MVTNKQVAVSVPKQKKKKESVWIQVFKRLLQDKVAVVGLAGLAVLILLCILAPFITRYGPADMDLFNMNSGPSASHIWGTDSLGRDYLTRCLYGGRYSLLLGLSSSMLASVIGVVLGSIAGYFCGWADTIIMRLCDIIQSIPPMIISIIMSLALGNGYLVTIIALAVGGFSFSTRLTRGQVLSVRGSDYLDAAKTINCSSPRIMFKHILPNVVSPMLLDCTMKIAQMIQISAALSVIGLGVQPPTPEWGAMLSAGRSFILNYPYLVIFPGLCIFIASLLINIVGDSLRDAMDPKLKK